MAKRKIGIIGATGSIGTQAQDVISLNPGLFEVVFLTAHSNAGALEKAGKRFGTSNLILTVQGTETLIDTINDTSPDIVLIGAAGLDILSAVHYLSTLGITLAIANKECIVSAGKLIMEASNKSGGVIIPVDSEHSAIFQCIQGHCKNDVEKLTLTASGGAFRDHTPESLEQVSVEEALNHPNWSMGKKITVDSATMMNKGLELLEARILFDIEPANLDVVIHPQSIIHSFVSYRDGSVLAQMGLPDMRTPISYALGYPNRIISGAGRLDILNGMGELSFYEPDLKKYRCLDIALSVLKDDRQSLMIAMNASNELAVEAFLNGKISFTGIAGVIEDVLGLSSFSEPNSMEDVLTIDKHARSLTEQRLKK